MAKVRRSAPKSKTGCQTCKIRRVKCDELHPECQRCTSTGRTCDGYVKESPLVPIYASPRSIILVGDSAASSGPKASVADDVQERRSYHFFLIETFPNIAGFFGLSTWNLVLQACSREPVVSQAVVALGALHEASSQSLQSAGVDSQRALQTNFPLQQYSKALGALRQYMSATKGLNLNIILICALIHISIEVIQNNYANAIMHLEKSLQLLRQFRQIQDVETDQRSQNPRLGNVEVDLDLARAFLRLDLQASTYVGRRAPTLIGNGARHVMPAKFSSISQAKDVSDLLSGQLYVLIRDIVEPHRYDKDEDFPMEIVTQIARLKHMLEVWDESFEKYLSCSTSRFSRHEQLIINVLLLNHRMSTIQVATCTHREGCIFDQFDMKFDEIVTLAATVIWARNIVGSPVLNFSLDTGVIYPLYWTATKCREPWIRQRVMSLLRSITFQEGVWDAAAHAKIAGVAIAREGKYTPQDAAPDQRPPELARVHFVGTNVLDPVKRVAHVDVSQKLDGLDGTWINHTEWVTW